MDWRNRQTIVCHFYEKFHSLFAADSYTSIFLRCKNRSPFARCEWIFCYLRTKGNLLFASSWIRDCTLIEKSQFPQLGSSTGRRDGPSSKHGQMFSRLLFYLCFDWSVFDVRHNLRLVFDYRYFQKTWIFWSALQQWYATHVESEFWQKTPKRWMFSSRKKIESGFQCRRVSSLWIQVVNRFVHWSIWTKMRSDGWLVRLFSVCLSINM